MKLKKLLSLTLASTIILGSLGLSAKEASANSFTKWVTDQPSASYNSGGFSGTLSQYTHTPYSDTRVWRYQGNVSKPAVDTRVWKYEGYVTRPESDTRVYRYQGNVSRPASADTRVYRYQGNVTKPASADTRVYRYQGNVTKPASDTRVYKYQGNVTRPASKETKTQNISHTIWDASTPRPDNKFPATVNYNSGGFSGTLSKSGVPSMGQWGNDTTSTSNCDVATCPTATAAENKVKALVEGNGFNLLSAKAVYNGTYYAVTYKYQSRLWTQTYAGTVSKDVPADSKYVTNQNAKYYNSEGYTGTLTQYVHSGSYTPADTKHVTNQTSQNYNSGGYTGTLTQYLHSGSYTPAETMWVTNQSSQNYNSGGYTGTLTQYVHSGSYTPADTKYVTNETSQNYNSDGYTGTLTQYVHSGSYTPGDTKFVTDQTSQNYNSDGYTGTLTRYVHSGLETLAVMRWQGNVYSTTPNTVPPTITSVNDNSGNSMLVNWIRHGDTSTLPGTFSVVRDSSVVASGLSTLSFTDNNAKDNTAPATPSFVRVGTSLTLSSIDNGTSYSYRVRYIAPNNVSHESPSVDGTSLSGLRGFIIRGSSSATPNFSDVTKANSISKITHPTTTNATVNINNFTGEYIHAMAIDNQGNMSTPVAIIKDNDPPDITNMVVNFDSIQSSSVRYNIDVATVNDISDIDTNKVSYRLNGGAAVNNQGLKTTVTGLSPNTLQKLQFRLTDIANNQADWSREYTVYSGALQPQKGEVRGYDGTKAEVKFTREKYEGSIVNQRYQFKLVPVGGGADILSNEYREDTLAVFSGLETGKTYEVWGLGINEDNVKTDWNRIKNEDGTPLVINADSKAVTTVNGTFNWLTSTTPTQEIGLTVTDKDSVKEPLNLIVNGTSYLLLQNPFDRAGTQQSVNIKMTVSAGVAFKVEREIEGTSSVLKVTLPGLKQGINKIGLTGYDNELILGYDTEGPKAPNNSIKVTAIDANNFMMMLDSNVITDVSTQFGAMNLAIDNGTTLAEKLAVPVVFIKAPASGNSWQVSLKDRFGQATTVTVAKPAGGVTAPPPSDGGSVGPGGTTPGTGNDSGEASTPIETKNPVVDVPLPSAGSHYRTSLDGVTWSGWYPKNGLTETKITLPTGDGLKTTYVQTGEATKKFTPVYMGEAGIVNVATEEDNIIPINNTTVTKFEMDLTAPVLDIRTMDNSLIAKGGEITFLVDIVDAIDKQPRAQLTLSTKGTTKNGASVAVMKKSGTVPLGKTQLEFPISGLTEVYKNGKLTFYTLEVLTWDKSGNRNVKYVNFYVKN